MLKAEVNRIIQCYAADNKLSYNQLDYDEQCLIASHLILEDETPLVSADGHDNLLRAVAWVVKSNGSPNAMDHLKKIILQIFVVGREEPYLEPHYAEKVQDMLSQEWDEQHAQPNEHYEHDAMQRIRDIADEQRRNGSY